MNGSSESTSYSTLHDEIEESSFLYSTTMIADLLSVSVSTVRLLDRRGFLERANHTGRMPRYTAEELFKARRIVSWLQEGLSLSTIDRQYRAFSDLFPKEESLITHLELAPNRLELLYNRSNKRYDAQGHALLSLEFDPFGETASLTDRTSVPDDFLQTDLNAELPKSSFYDEVRRRLLDRMTDTFSFSQEDRTELSTFISKHILSLCELAVDLERVGQLDEARALYVAALRSGGPDPAICFQLAELLHRQGELLAARERYYMVLEMDRDDLIARLNLTRVLHELGERLEAIELVESVLAAQPDLMEAEYELGLLLMETGKNERGKEHLRRYLSHLPEQMAVPELIERLLS